MAWYDSAGPAGAGFMAANKQFSEMNSREFENALRDAQVQQLMQQMQMAPQRFGMEQQEAELKRRQLEQAMQMGRQDFGLKQRHQNYLEELMRMQGQPKQLTTKDLLQMDKIREEIVGLRQGRETAAQKELRDALKSDREGDANYQRDLAAAKQLPPLPSPISPLSVMSNMGEIAPNMGVEPYGGRWAGSLRSFFTGDPKFTKDDLTAVLGALTRAQRLNTQPATVNSFMRMFK